MVNDIQTNNIIDTLTFVNNSFKNNKHLYIILINGKLTTTWDKDSASSIQTISRFILQFANKLKGEKKKAVLDGYHVISQSYKNKHNTLIAKILRIFLFFYRDDHRRTLALIQETQKKLELKFEDKNKIKSWKLTEKEADSYIQADDITKATILRLEAAKSLPPAPLFRDMHLRQEDPKLGLVLQPIGPNVFKQQSLFIQTRTFTDGDQQIHIGCELTHPMRAKLQKTLKCIEKNTEQFSAALPKDFCRKVTITEEQQITFYPRITLDDQPFEGSFSKKDVVILNKLDTLIDNTSYTPITQVIHFEGVGIVKINHHQDIHSLYPYIQIDLDASVAREQAAEKLHLLFAILGLGTASSSPLEKDIKRLKIMQLFRIFYPKEAYVFEHDPMIFEESINSLKGRIVKVVPDMKSRFENHLSEMYKQPVYPGQYIFSVKGLAMRVREVGGKVLMAGIHVDSFHLAAKRLASILKIGALSHLDRYEKGMLIKGGDPSGETDLVTGGANSVFTRLITSQMTKYAGAYFMSGKIQIFYHLDLIERGGYAYWGDEWGAKDKGSYSKRFNILNLTHACEKDPYGAKDNEICIRNYIPSQFIIGVLVKNVAKKNKLITILKSADLVNKNEAQEDCINGILLDEFIHVGDTFPMK